MARIRAIKPEYWEDEKLSNASIQARLLFIGMWNYSDDQGVVRATAKFLKSKVFPYDEISFKEIESWCAQLVECRAILPFQYEGESYFVIRTFKSHQKIDARYAKYSVPEQVVENVIDKNTTVNTAGTRREHSGDPPGPQKVPTQERRGEERIGSGSGSGEEVKVDAETPGNPGSPPPPDPNSKIGFEYSGLNAESENKKNHQAGAGPPPLSKTARSNRRKNPDELLSLEEWGDRERFDVAMPDDWPPEKKDHYWFALLNYSNKGNRYKDWALTAQNWARKDAANNDPTPWLKKPAQSAHNGHNAHRQENPADSDIITTIIQKFNEYASMSYDTGDITIRGWVVDRLHDGADPNDIFEIIQLKSLEWGTGEKRHFLKLNVLLSNKNYPNFLQEVQDIKAGKKQPNLTTQQIGKIRHERIKQVLGQDF